MLVAPLSGLALDSEQNVPSSHDLRRHVNELFAAITKNDTETVRRYARLLSRQGVLSSYWLSTTHAGVSPLLHAAKHDYADIVLVLLEAKANPNIVLVENPETPLLVCAACCVPALFYFLFLCACFRDNHMLGVSLTPLVTRGVPCHPELHCVSLYKTATCPLLPYLDCRHPSPATVRCPAAGKSPTPPLPAALRTNLAMVALLGLSGA